MSHTPGPWRVDRTVALGAYGVWTDYGCEHNPNGPENPCLIASVYPSNQSDLPREERDANACLIKAAPSMYAALKGILEDDAPTTSLADQRARWDARMDAARAAVAEAEESL